MKITYYLRILCLCVSNALAYCRFLSVIEETLFERSVPWGDEWAFSASGDEQMLVPRGDERILSASGG